MNEPEIGIGDPNRKTLTWGYVLARSYELYAKRFWTYFRMALLPATIALFVRSLVLLIAQQLRGMGWLGHKWSLGTSLTLAEQGLYWVTSAFFFAAVAANVLSDEDGDSVPFSDAYSKARERLGGVIVVALIVWTLFIVTRGLALLAIFEVLQRVRSHWIVQMIAFLLPIWLIAGLLSRLGLAIPELINNPKTSISAAIRSSIRKTENWEPFFMAFLAKSAILGYGAYWLGNSALDWLWGQGALNETSYPWAERLIYITIAAALEPPLFIAFSVLYVELKGQQENSPAAAS